LVSQLEEAGVRIVDFPFPRLFSPISFIRLVKFLRQEKFDLVHAYLTYSNIVGSLAARLCGIPVVASLRNAEFDQGRFAIRTQIEGFALRHLAHRILANGNAVGLVARTRSGNTPVDIIVNAVDTIPSLLEDERNALRQELVGDAQRPLILSVGRLTEAKGFFDLLNAFKIIHSAHAGAALVIAGGGGLRDELTVRMRELKIQNDVFLLGSRDDVHRLLAAADIYVSSSLWEGTPVSVLEAMSAGLPVVGTAVGEIPFLLDQDAGLLVPPNQPEQIAAAIISLLDSPEKRAGFGQAARTRIKENYGRKAWSRSILSLYAKFLPKANEYLAKLDDETSGLYQ
jgi:glycosyltransferase involved in cell wall biosynthesis